MPAKLIALNAAQTARYRAAVAERAPNECWEWTRAVGSHGYGSLWIHPKLELAHRIAWCLARGSIPEGMSVLHRCDNRRCCNPAHLFLGTDKDNSDDKIAKGRANVAFGEAAGRALLTERDVRQIRADYLPYHVTQQMLADRYGVARETVCSVLRGESWRAVSSP